MRAFLITTLCASLVYAKPQYNYPAPAPAPSIPSGSYGSPAVGGSFASGGGAIASGGGGGFGGGFGDSSFTGSGGIGGRQTGGGIAAGFASGGGGAGGGGAGGGFIGGGGGGTLVQKHIYVHVAPPEPEEARPQRPIAAGQSTKHYKIIFIKAPSYQSYQQQILQAQAQNEEKTLVYVLVKKPDDVADITLPTAAPTAPSKPEVYFIRYKAKSEVSGGGGGGGIGGGAGIGGAGIGGASQLSGSGAGLGVGASLNLASSSSSSSQFNLNAGSSSSGVSVGRPATNYGPPGQSGPY